MPLDDFFAKKEKKKSKKKRNPQELIEKLTKEVEKLKEQDGETVNDTARLGVNLGKDDEWEAIEEEDRDIEVQNVRIGNLELAPVEDVTKPPTKEKGDKEVGEESEDTKKVWALKVADVKEEPEEEEKPQPPPEPEPPKKYIPVYLRPGGAASSLAPKPNVSSDTDFPTLDAACTTEPAGKNKTPASPPHEDDDNAGWSQAGASQRPARAQNMLPISVNTNPSVYVPPALRSGGSFPPAPAPATRFESRQEFRSSRPRESMASRPEGLGGGFRSEGIPARETLSTNFDGWSRGATIDPSKAVATGPSGGSPFSTKVHSPSRPSYTPANYSTDTNSGWARNVNVKTFKESGREKAEFELVQTNRFAGLEES